MTYWTSLREQRRWIHAFRGNFATPTHPFHKSHPQDFTNGPRVTDYIHVRNWDRFQHADTTKRGRTPTWIKNYTRLLSDDNYLDLTPAQRAVLHGIWLEHARSGGKVPNDTAKLSRRLGTRVTERTLDTLQTRGFIDRETSPKASRNTPENPASAQPQHTEAKAAPTKTREMRPNRQDNVTPPTRLEEKREETTSTSSPAGPVVEGWVRVGDLDAFRRLRRTA